MCAQRMVLAPGEVVTTEYVRAPEVFLGVERCTDAIDVWAIGIVGVALLCGSTIFWRPEPYEPKRSGFETRHDGEDGWHSILANQAGLGAKSKTLCHGRRVTMAWLQRLPIPTWSVGQRASTAMLPLCSATGRGGTHGCDWELVRLWAVLFSRPPQFSRRQLQWSSLLDRTLCGQRCCTRGGLAHRSISRL